MVDVLMQELLVLPVVAHDAHGHREQPRGVRDELGGSQVVGLTGRAVLDAAAADEPEAEQRVVLVAEGALEHDVVGARAQLVEAARDVRLR